MSRRHNSQNRNNQIEAFGNMMDPFAEMKQMMRGFGGFNDDDMLSLMPRMNDPFEDMFKFSDLHKNVHTKGKQGSYVCQTFVSSSAMGPDGKMKSQNYYQNSMGQNKGGQTISQKQQAYKNSDGLNRIAEERMLNDKGRKIMKEKRGHGPIEQTNHYYNIDEEEVAQFDNQWNGANHNIKFLQNHQKYIKNGYREQPRAINYQPEHRNRGYQQPNSNTRNIPISNSRNMPISNHSDSRNQMGSRRAVQQPIENKSIQGSRQFRKF